MRKKGNLIRQRAKRARRSVGLVKPPKQPVKFTLIDGNLSCYPRAYCLCHKGYLTSALMNTHRCERRACVHLRWPLRNKKGRIVVGSFQDTER